MFIIKKKNLLAKNLEKTLGISGFLSKLLVSRNITDPEEADIFLNRPESENFDPLIMKDMDKALDILKEVKEKKEKVAIFGDYDVDGVTSSSVLYLGLRNLGFEVTVYIPSRIEEGYSLNENALHELKNKGFQNIITVDCGITSLKEIDYAKKLGMKVIVTDHHLPQDTLPKADAILNPKRKDDNYPFKDLAGVGVTFKLLQALFKNFDNTLDPYEYIDLVALGTIADIVPILSENRYFVKLGIEKLKSNPSKGIKYLLDELKIVESEINSRTITFKIAPKINAAGRMADAYAAFKLLTEEDDERLKKAVSELLKLNSRRQSTEKEIYLYAMSLLDLYPTYKTNPVLVLGGENWHLGVLGIVASKLSAQFNKPVLMISKNGEYCKGSGRSPQGIDLMDLFLKVNENNIFEEFGGHKFAAGFSLFSKNIDKLRESINKVYKDIYGDKKLSFTLDIDMEIDKIWDGMFDDIEKLEPFGHGNTEPVFLIRNGKLENLKFFSNGFQNFSGTLNKDSLMIDVLGYDLGHYLKELIPDKKRGFPLDLAGTFRIENSYNLKNSYIKFYVQDLKIEKSFQSEDIQQKYFVDGILKNELSRVTNINVLNENLTKNKVAMFLPSKIKNDTILSKIFICLKNKEKVVVVSATNSLLEHIYKIISAYFPEEFLYFDNNYILDQNAINDHKVVFVTVPKFAKNLKIFDSFNAEIIIDEPFYSLFHPVIKKISYYQKFRRYILQRNHVGIFGTIYNENLKEYLRASGYKILTSFSKNNAFEVIRENNNILKLLNDYSNDKNSKVLVLDNSERQKSLAKLLDLKLNVSEHEIKFFNHSMSYREKLIARDKFKNENANFYITSFSNNGIAFEVKKFPPTLIITDVPKTDIEFLDLVSTWMKKNQKVTIILAYNNRFRVKLLYEYSKKYPSFKILKNTYDFIQEGHYNTKEIYDSLFEGDDDFSQTVLNVLEDAQLVKKYKDDLQIIDTFSLKKLRESANFEENILDNWILKHIIKFYENLDTRELIDLLKGNFSEVGARGV
ncbi:single-stranded-DNA-specific exonuclease RecJ [Petrotoga sp. 9PW.55.5.1]|uniref:single-stranded-DNA-specific exonuclease RecJ n=1 Tax=Petrotoga sp. 9PW.55.5.1 TaxID=1308979 RepID=UPI000DDBE012|nr:single-stranded-DNA-specific exonuclease RecJ [Petrotoga sp. 9PW.55.5.1]